MENKNNLTNRQIQAMKTRERLFKSAISLFGEKGYESVTVDEIAARAGTSKGAFYTYFKTKSQVVVMQFQEIDKHYIKTRKTFKKYKTAGEKLLVFVREQLSYTKEQMGLEVISTVYRSQLDRNEEKAVINHERPFYKIVNEIIEEGQKSGEFRDDTPSAELTEMVTRCMRATFFDWAVHNGGFDFIENGYKFFADFIIRALKK